MTPSTTVVRKKRGRPVTGQNPVSAIRLSADLRKAIDRAIADEADQPSRSEFIRRLLTDHLRAKGYLPSASDGTAQ